MSFREDVYKVVEIIPKGHVMTYKDVAAAAGSPGAYRAVGTAMRNNPDMSAVPCHRVVGSDGEMHGYAAECGVKAKIRKLKSEGVKFVGERVDLAKCRYK